MIIKKDNIEIVVERPITQLRNSLSESFIDFSLISKLVGDKGILSQTFKEIFFECIND